MIGSPYLISYLFSNLFPHEKCCKDLNKCKSVGSMCGLYGGWAITFHPKSLIFWDVIFVTCGLAPCCWKMTPLLTKAGRFLIRFSFNLFNCSHYFLGSIVSLYLSNSQRIISRRSHQNESLAFLGWSPGFGVGLGNWAGETHCFCYGNRGTESTFRRQWQYV